MMKAIVLGGTSGMGRAIARLLASRGDSVFLMGIGSQELERSAADFERAPPRAGRRRLRGLRSREARRLRGRARRSRRILGQASTRSS